MDIHRIVAVKAGSAVPLVIIADSLLQKRQIQIGEGIQPKALAQILYRLLSAD